MRYLLLTAAMVAAAPANATIFWSNFDVGTVEERTTGGAWPTVERTPVETYANGSTLVGVGSAVAGGFPFYSASFDFTVGTSFVADRAITAFQQVNAPFAQRIFLSIAEVDTLTGTGTAIGSLQLQANGLPFGRIVEVDAPFGTNMTNLEALFDYRPISFTAGGTYRATFSFATGGIGLQSWILSDTVAATGTASSSVTVGSGTTTTALGFQPTLALTDGGDLVPLPGPGAGGGAVPEPESWALMIAGFGLVGASLRRRRAAALA
ncbi:PEPxxWA-CTERM sorting domain-containing protein [Polymorphobacter sp.]|uniref:PEPxxWA-CTERM sorting domain-containing protein n=1 Tax=Polymorphobacter sp. TaxID=1909290 RepID=UPI003F70E614